MRTRHLALLVILASCAHPVASCAHPAAMAPATPLDRVVRDVCQKRIVMLGEEAHHRGGATLAVKAALVQRLVDECGFSVVLFEASLPELVSLNRALAAGTASPAHVADAIGGLWSVAAESDPLIATLFERAARKQVVLAGLDGQVGSTNLYAQTQLAGELTGYLAEPRRAACQGELDRNARWQYNDASPFDDAARARLQGCLAEIEAAASRPARPPADEAVAMAAAWRAAIAMNDATLSRSAAFNVRDQAMYRALQWHLARLPRDSKVLVWCATIHAARSLRAVPGRDELVPLGSYVHRDFGATAAAIGISARAGSYGRGNAPATAIAPAPAGALEAAAFTGDLAYLGPADLRGTRTARPLDHDQLVAAPWHEVLDGLLVLRAEHPLTYAHDPTPRRAPSPRNL